MNEEALYLRLFSEGPSKADRMRGRIVAAAVDLMATEGLENTNFNTLAKRLKIGRAHVSYYFKDRDDIVEAVVQLVTRVAQDLTIQSLAQATTPREQLAQIIESAFEWYEAYPKHHAVMLTFYSLAAHERRFR